MKPNLTDLFLCPVNPSESGSTGSGNLLTRGYKPEFIYLATVPGDWNQSFEKGFTMYWDRLGSVVWVPTLSRELHTWYMLVSILTWRELSTETGYIRVHFFPDIITRVIRTYIYIIIGLVSKTRKQRGLYAYKPVHMCIQVLHIGPGIQAPCCRQNPKQNHDLSTGWGQHNSLIPPASTRLRKKTKNSTGLQAPCFRQIPKQNHDLVTGCSENPNSTGFAYLG